MAYLLIIVATALVTVFLVRIYDKVRFERRVRKYKPYYGEPCVLDVDEKNILHFHQGSMDLVMKDLYAIGLPDYLCEYMRKLMIARGISKALVMRRELVNFKKVMYHMVHQYEASVHDLGRFLSLYYAEHRKIVDENRRMGHAIMHKELATMRGAVNILRDVRGWTKHICCVPRYPTSDYKQMFLAGDSGIWCKPEGMLCQRLYDHFQTIVFESRKKMRELITIEGWPLLPELPGTKLVCRLCKQQFSKAWVERGVCWKCEDFLRSEGKCPYERGHPSFICPHTQKCFSCEMASCKECGLMRGDGIIVDRLVKDLKPSFVFIDFDQTLCSTKSGLQPTIGKHGLNPHLLSIVARHPQVYVVTKQNVRHAEFLEHFIRSHLSLPALQGSAEDEEATVVSKIVPEKVQLRLRCLGSAVPKRSKAEVIREIMAGREQETAIFVDDTTREHLDPHLVSFTNVQRILFSTTDFSVVKK